MKSTSTNHTGNRIGSLFYPNSISKQLTVGLVVLVCVLEGILLGGVYSYIAHHLRIDNEKKISTELNAIEENLTRLLWAMDYEEISGMGRFYYHTAFINGISIWGTGDTLIYRQLAVDIEDNSVKQSIDLRYNDIDVGRAEIYFSTNNYQQKLADMRNSFLITFIISLLIILIFTGILLRFILKKSLLAVTNWINKIGEGHYSYQYDGRVQRELIDIVSKFRRMAVSLDEKEQRLVKSNQQLALKVEEQQKTAVLLTEAQVNLEQKISERTAELHYANQELLRISLVDGLTQIANRRQFDERLKFEWERGIREKKNLSLIVCDIDYFKNYNDSFGHQAGDDCLKRIAQLINDNLGRTSDLVSRYGGEEFAVILPDTDDSGALKVASRIQKKLDGERILTPSGSIQNVVTMSMGVATCLPTSEKTREGLFSAADKALYKAKGMGRNCIVSNSEDV